MSDGDWDLDREIEEMLKLFERVLSRESWRLEDEEQSGARQRGRDKLTDLDENIYEETVVEAGEAAKPRIERVHTRQTIVDNILAEVLEEIGAAPTTSTTAQTKKKTRKRKRRSNKRKKPTKRKSKSDKRKKPTKRKRQSKRRSRGKRVKR